MLGVDSAGCSFTPAQLSHVGRHYDLTRDERPFRIVIGQEVGGKGKACTTLAERYE
jgi:hypothetical protein